MAVFVILLLEPHSKYIYIKHKGNDSNIYPLSSLCAGKILLRVDSCLPPPAVI